MNYIQLQYADIYYNITSKDDILRLSKNDKFQGIMKFFNLQNLSNKAIIKNQDVNFDDWYNLMIHEFTHYCTKEYTNYTLGSKWIQEGLAINLSHQRFL